MNEEKVYCELNKTEVLKKSASRGFTIRPSIFKLIQEKSPDFNNDSWICNDDLKKIKLKYVESLVYEEEKDKAEIKNFIAKAVSNHEFLTTDYLNSVGDDDEDRTFNEKISDKIAEFGGSWSFIFLFLFFVLVWCCFNTYVLTTHSFDPYPYIFLNLVLGCVASLQAPFIMMSQNRTSNKDRKRALNDYKVNLKSEFVIQLLREKIDHVINKQNPHILDILEEYSNTLEEIKETLSELKYEKSSAKKL